MVKQKKYSNCQNCGKPTEGGKFCSPECGELFYRKPEGAKPLAVKQDNDFALLQRTVDKRPENKVEVFKIELDLLDKSLSKRVELGLARGSAVKGIVTGFDERYGKIAVKVTENNQTKTVIVRLGYVVSFAVYD